MVTVVWKSDFATGVDEIDRQQRQLFAVVNKFQETLASETDSEHCIVPIIDDTLAHAKRLFGTEEQLMAASNVASLEFGIHQAEHQAFLDEMQRLRASDAPPEQLLKFQAAWLHDHMLQSDRHMAQILRTGTDTGIVAGNISTQLLLKHLYKVVRENEQRLSEALSKRTEELMRINLELEREKQEQLSLNKRLKETQVHLIQSEKMASIGLLAAGVAHEINNPLGYIFSNLNSLQHYLQDIARLAEAGERLAAQLSPEHPELQAYRALQQELNIDFLLQDMHDLVKESLEGASRATQIVQDLKDFSRSDKQHEELFNIEEGLDATLNIVHNELKYKAEIVKEYAGLNPVYCIGAQLNQVFMNLLVNAAQAIENFGKITIRTGLLNEEKLYVEIEDTGVGIAPDIVKKIFDPFFTTKPAGKGTGLGLALSYKIVQKHRGEIVVDSRAGQGSKFRVILPIRKTAPISN
ncbi:MAG: ATP-binding protein [Gammaproteobacteria bacterium]